MTVRRRLERILSGLGLRPHPPQPARPESWTVPLPAAGPALLGRLTDVERARLMRRGVDCANPDHDHCMQRLGQVIAERDQLRRRNIALEDQVHHLENAAHWPNAA